MGYRKNVNKANKANSSVDKAQNALLKSMKKKLDELEGDIESKYNISRSSAFINSYDGDTEITRERNIIHVPIGINQGVADTMRIGDEVTLKHIDLNYRINLASVVGTQYLPLQTTCRVMLFWDNQPSAVSSVGASIVNPVSYPLLLQNALTGATNDNMKNLVILSEKDWDNRKRFSIIYDKTHTFCPNTNSVTSSGLAGLRGARSCGSVIEFNKNYNGQKIRFAGGGTFEKNRRLYLCFLSDCGNDVAGNSAVMPVIHYSTRVIYDDA